jgi:hypothetical protein
MHSAIVLDESVTQAAVVETVEFLNDVKAFADILVASTRPAPDNFSVGVWITAKSLPEAVTKATTLAASKRVFVVSSAIAFAPTDLSKLVPEIENRDLNEHILVALTNGNNTIEMPNLAPEAIVATLQNHALFPLMCISTSRSTLNLAALSQSDSVAEILTKTMIVATTDGDKLRLSSTITPTVSSEMIALLYTLSNAAKARCLRAVVDGLNIEEIFPQHNWKLFSAESAAASYHSLAALFLRFEDPDSAAQCLACSEKLEESPRYFALQGLIQQAHGETLGAVASLVSSLQCYESRKTADGAHYLSFKPTNLEIIKTRLAEGLDALNKRDNARALSSFSEAVFNFDSFYSEHGVQSPSKGSN